ncbi:unnamed protein product [Choristocarpus tenellus]
MEPLLPPERYLAQEALSMAAFSDWEAVLDLAPPPPEADFVVAVHHFARSLAFLGKENWEGYLLEQSLISTGVPSMEKRADYYGIYQAPELTHILDLISRAEGLRASVLQPVSQPLVDVVSDLREEENTREGWTAKDSITEEIKLLWEAVAVQEALDYDEPPDLPVPPKLYLGAALLRAGEAAEAKEVFEWLEEQYPHMGRTSLGLAQASLALGDLDRTRDYLKSFESSWRFAEVWLDDSAHVGGLLSSPCEIECGNTVGGAAEVLVGITDMEQADSHQMGRTFMGVIIGGLGCLLTFAGLVVIGRRSLVPLWLRGRGGQYVDIKEEGHEKEVVVVI